MTENLPEREYPNEKRMKLMRIIAELGDTTIAAVYREVQSLGAADEARINNIIIRSGMQGSKEILDQLKKEIERNHDEQEDSDQ